ncbi:phage holin family protein [Nocardia sp. CDC159]|uniref:Phage holin family protein n=1 Tax=Nocardia pulmonis TaxID=2951408 RepID=A0A9X2EC87_9NOCA|nr:MULTISPECIES: phage holin family protein [Nocardia]MCM6778197.1 phage holin family protein [Nocardia pulmonis]MCM6791086.1 phage holin family protein [Nocardia sp. CDC159]
MTDTHDSRAADSPPVAELIGNATEQLSRLVREEIRLAAIETQSKAQRFGLGAGLAGVAAMLALLGAGTLVAAAVLALALALPAWAAALIVAAALFGIALVAALAGRSGMRRAAPPIPERAVADVRRDIEVVKERSHR